MLNFLYSPTLTSIWKSNLNIGRTDPEAEAPILWQPDAKNQLIGNDPVAEKNLRYKENGAAEDEITSQTQWT